MWWPIIVWRLISPVFVCFFFFPSCKETHLFVFHYTFMYQILLIALLTFHLKCIELRIVCFFFMSLEYVFYFRSKYATTGAHIKGKKIKRRKTKKYGWEGDVHDQYHFQGEAKQLLYPFVYIVSAALYTFDTFKTVIWTFDLEKNRLYPNFKKKEQTPIVFNLSMNFYHEPATLVPSTRFPLCPFLLLWIPEYSWCVRVTMQLDEVRN